MREILKSSSVFAIIIFSGLFLPEILQLPFHFNPAVPVSRTLLVFVYAVQALFFVALLLPGYSCSALLFVRRPRVWPASRTLKVALISSALSLLALASHALVRLEQAVADQWPHSHLVSVLISVAVAWGLIFSVFFVTYLASSRNVSAV